MACGQNSAQKNALKLERAQHSPQRHLLSLFLLEAPSAGSLEHPRHLVWPWEGTCEQQETGVDVMVEIYQFQNDTVK